MHATSFRGHWPTGLTLIKDDKETAIQVSEFRDVGVIMFLASEHLSSKLCGLSSVDHMNRSPICSVTLATSR